MRDISAALLADLPSDHVRWGLLFTGVFDSGTIRLWSGSGPLEYSGDTYEGGGSLISVGSVRESEDLRADSTQVSLSGLPTSILSLALTEDYQGRDVYIDYVHFDDEGQIIGEPLRLMSGRADKMTTQDDGQTASITLTVENEVARFNRPSGRRYTAQAQRDVYPFDAGFDFIAALESTDINWGGKDSSRTSSSTPPPIAGELGQ